MQIVKGEIRNEFSRDLYWGRIQFTSDDKSKTSNVLFCASTEYLWNLFHDINFKQNQLNAWYEDTVVKKWESFGDQIFEDEVYFDSYSVTAEGKANGFEFLQTKIKT